MIYRYHNTIYIDMPKKFTSITQARKDFYTIAEEVQKPNTHYVLTVHGQPKGVLLSYDEFEAMMEAFNKKTPGTK